MATYELQEYNEVPTREETLDRLQLLLAFVATVFFLVYYINGLFRIHRQYVDQKMAYKPRHEYKRELDDVFHLDV